MFLGIYIPNNSYTYIYEIVFEYMIISTEKTAIIKTFNTAYDI